MLEPDTVARAEALGLTAQGVVEGFLVGEHRSPFHGFSVEFTQHRAYTQGEDLRHLDHRVLGRTDRHYIKQYEQETNLIAHILVDCSESMAFASGVMSKFDYARQLAACWLYLVLGQGDSCTLTLFDTSTRWSFDRMGSLGKLPAVLTALAAAEATSLTNMPAAVRHLAQQAGKRGVVVIISDLLSDETSFLESLRSLAVRGHQVAVFHTLDPQELSFEFDSNPGSPPSAVVRLDGMEDTGETFARPAEARSHYLSAMGDYLDTLKRGCAKAGVDYSLADTARPMADVVGQYLARCRMRGSASSSGGGGA